MSFAKTGAPLQKTIKSSQISEYLGSTVSGAIFPKNIPRLQSKIE
jgi:hypothetical protein